MKFYVTFADEYEMPKSYEIEINSIQDLYELSKKYGYDLILTFKGVEHDWNENEITVYNGYVE